MKHAFLALGLAAALSGCGALTIKSNPNTYSVRDKTAAVKPTQIAIVNSFATETPATILVQGGTSWVIDLRQVTDTAVQVMSRHLVKNGMTVTPQAPKTVTLTIKNVSTQLLGFAGTRITLSLEAKYGDGTVSLVTTENRSPADAGQVLDGAVLFAVTQTLNHDAFVAYVNR